MLPIVYELFYQADGSIRLNTFLELKLEKERLLQRRRDLRAAISSIMDPISPEPISSQTPTTSRYPDMTYTPSSSTMFLATDESASGANTIDSSAVSETFSQRPDDANDESRRKRVRLIFSFSR